MKLLANVFATSPSGEKVFLAAGTEAPKWAHGVITNPAVLAQADKAKQDDEADSQKDEDPAGKEEDSAPEGEDPAGKEEDSAPEGEDPAGEDEDAELRAKLSKHTADQLRDLASEQGLSTAGNKAELIDRLLG